MVFISFYLPIRSSNVEDSNHHDLVDHVEAYVEVDYNLGCRDVEVDHILNRHDVEVGCIREVVEDNRHLDVEGKDLGLDTFLMDV